MPSVDYTNGYVWFTGCPYCESEEAEEYGFTVAKHQVRRKSEDEGRYCKVCGAFISVADFIRWLKENDNSEYHRLKSWARSK